MSLPPDLIHDMQKALGSLRTDLTARLLYSTDASIYQIEPLGVAFPRSGDELAAAVEISAHYDIPVLARGSGSSLAGQAIGQALILDCSRHLNRILGIDLQSRTATVEPGVILTNLNREAAVYGLQFGPDPASADRATIGGSIANNATGAHSILYGMAADHLLSAEVVLSDGSLATFESLRLEEVRRLSKASSILGKFYQAALEIRERCSDHIRENWPRTWRNASGYPLNYLLPWSPSQPPQWEAHFGRGESTSSAYPPVPADHINLAPLLAGSEGTLAVIKSATLGLVQRPKHTMLGVLAFPSLATACDATPGILEHCPSAVELIPESLIRLARSLPAYARQLSFLDPIVTGTNPVALLVVEFSGDAPGQLKERVKRLGPDVLLAETQLAQLQVWAVRKVGLGILNSRPGSLKPVAFIEDLSVPVQSLGDFVRGMEQILSDHDTLGDFYAHASAGCLHIRPILDLKSAGGRRNLRAIATQAVELTINLGGSVSGEHGDGLARSEWLEQMYGEEILKSFRHLKNAADPTGILNPGKIIPAQEASPLPKMDENLRYGGSYRLKAWQPAFDYSRYGENVVARLEGEAGLVAAVEQCNGAGVCRKPNGLMCPSFQATQDEMHSTRGRANLLRAMMSGRFPTDRAAERTVYEALDLCLACKGCKSECPSGVDVAKLRYEFLNHYYQRRRRRVRDYLFGYIGVLARLGYPFAPIANTVLGSRISGQMVARLLGLASQRPFPRLAGRPLKSQARELLASDQNGSERVLFLSDAFTDYFYPDVGVSAIRVLRAAGCQVTILPVSGAGRTLISKGFLDAAKAHANRLLNAIDRADPEGRMPVVGVEPSEIYTLRDEYFDMFPGKDWGGIIAALARRSFAIDELLVRPGSDGKVRQLRIADDVLPEKAKKQVLILLHGHCYQKAQPPAADGYPTGVLATIAMLEAAGYMVELIESSCCGMAGAFGYESEHYELSMKVGELGLFPSIRASGEDVIIAAAGVSCQAQIEDGTHREVLHPIVLLDPDHKAV